LIEQGFQAICSLRSPPVSTTVMGLPPPSARRCSLVENPPWLRPSASALSWPPMTPGWRRAAGAGGVLMGANHGRIDEV